MLKCAGILNNLRLPKSDVSYIYNVDIAGKFDIELDVGMKIYFNKYFHLDKKVTFLDWMENYLAM